MKYAATSSKRLSALPTLHASSWVVCAFAAFAFALIAVPGMIREPYLAWYPGYSHGWPAEFLFRQVDDAPVVRTDQYLFVAGDPALLDAPDAPPWSSMDSWRLWHADESHWQWRNLAFDLFVGTAIVGAVTAFWEWRRRHRSRPMQFSLTQMAVCIAMVPAVFGIWKFQVREATKEQRVVDSMELGLYFDEGIVAHEWLQRLVGRGVLKHCSSRVTEIVLYPDELEKIAQLAPALAQFEWLHKVSIDSTEGRDLSVTFAALSHLDSMRVLDMSSLKRSELLFNENAVEALTRLKQLREIRFWAEEETRSDLLKTIREELPGCRIRFMSEI